MAETDPKSSSPVKEWVTLVTALTALVAAIGAAFKPQDQTSTKMSYETLAKAVQEASAATARNHDDLVALRSYLEGYMEAQQPKKISAPPEPVAGIGLGSFGTIGHGAGSGSGSGFGSGYGRIGSGMKKPTKPKPPPAPVVDASISEPQMAEALPDQAAPEPALEPAPLPELHDRPPVWSPPAFDQLGK